MEHPKEQYYSFSDYCDVLNFKTLNDLFFGSYESLHEIKDLYGFLTVYRWEPVEIINLDDLTKEMIDYLEDTWNSEMLVEDTVYTNKEDYTLMRNALAQITKEWSKNKCQVVSKHRFKYTDVMKELSDIEEKLSTLGETVL